MRLASTGIRDYKEYPVLLNLFNFFFGIFSTIIISKFSTSWHSYSYNLQVQKAVELLAAFI